MRPRLLTTLALIVTTGLLSAQDEKKTYSWKTEEGKHIDLYAGDRPIVRYVLEPLDAERREETYKPFHHVYDAEGKDFITKGPGGKFTHHRGIYFGFSRIKFTNAEGKEEGVDTWHSKKAYTEHVEVLEEEVSATGAHHKVKIEWRSDASGTFINEERRMAFSEVDGGLLVDFQSTLTTDLDKVVLDGDPQHAGFQFRASNEVSEKTAKETVYIRPGSGPAEPGHTINWSSKDDTEATRDLPWKGMIFTVGGERYSTAYLDHPSNPKPARYSERDYGRFGSYFVAEVTPNKPLSVHYQLFIRKGEITADEIKALSARFVGPAQ